MRILADENIPHAVITALVRHGHDVTGLGDREHGIVDQQVVARAEREGRIILTFDKDFGEIAFASEPPARCGIILLRFVPRDPDDAVSVVLAALAVREDWSGHFVVVERDRLRARRLRSPPRHDPR